MNERAYKTEESRIIGFLCRDEDGNEYTVRRHPRRGKPIHAPDDAFEWLSIHHQKELGDSRESFICMYLDTRRRVLTSRVISMGTLDASLVHPREVFGFALEARAAAVVVCHNHPSGDPEPSPEDLALTSRLDRAASLLGIRLVDHLVVAGPGYVSLRQRQNEGGRGIELFRT